MENYFATIFLISLATLVVLSSGQGTRVGFYSRTCPRAESIVQSTVRSHVTSNRTIAPGLLRMHFHDCFVQGCDASILVDGDGTEKTAGANAFLRGYEVVEDAKRQLETACPGVVSCADILALAARDSVVLSGGIGWSVPTGRRDGRVSNASFTGNLPSPLDTVDVQIQKFLDKGLNTQDLVALVGAHTIGTAACVLFINRLYDFNLTGRPDPSIDASFLTTLQSLCPNNTNSGPVRVALDNGSENRFDNSYFANLRSGRGVLDSDQGLWADSRTRAVVQRFLGGRGLLGLTFGVEFGRSMVRMSNVDVKTGTDGEIRRVCSAVN